LLVSLLCLLFCFLCLLHFWARVPEQACARMHLTCTRKSKYAHTCSWPMHTGLYIGVDTMESVLESPPSFCNDLGTMNIASSQERTIDLTTRDMVLGLRYVLGKVLGTQDRPTRRLASHHCVLHLNLNKSMFNTCILTLTHTSIHQNIQHGIIHPKTHTYPSIKHKEPNHTHI